MEKDLLKLKNILSKDNSIESKRASRKIKKIIYDLKNLDDSYFSHKKAYQSAGSLAGGALGLGLGQNLGQQAGSFLARSLGLGPVGQQVGAMGGALIGSYLGTQGGSIVGDIAQDYLFGQKSEGQDQMSFEDQVRLISHGSRKTTTKTWDDPSQLSPMDRDNYFVRVDLDRPAPYSIFNLMNDSYGPNYSVYGPIDSNVRKADVQKDKSEAIEILNVGLGKVSPNQTFIIKAFLDELSGGGRVTPEPEPIIDQGPAVSDREILEPRVTKPISPVIPELARVEDAIMEQSNQNRRDIRQQNREKNRAIRDYARMKRRGLI